MVTSGAALESVDADPGRLARRRRPPAAFELRQPLAGLCLALGQLPPVERELLGLRELAGLPYAELASCTGLTIPAVESALRRARRRLLAAAIP